ncbi:IS110 family transposase [Mucilaginibacter celer]|uniref:IS110 family transposase n=1 Tax=Mucilaginibacter celer TaxID=2305508 RepID=A0A494VUQ4_9SPHI|nr:IS110 family transposase [Mucilaginibacter celer]AYL97410.1 IS110 family transposase [Mucilaginibacter celer]AYL97780.1 IS110 family transposase [Mucilaginibacter celer]AYL97781.1 IS110 family transposase [Mucilaginibacter celer]AYL98772.1 IS110 family transposase [Mucilaginibacter celer]
MAKETTFETVHQNVAGIDIGAEQIFVSPDGKEVVSFETFTSSYYACAVYLKERGVKKVAMEATGVYWIALYFLLEELGILVCLVNPKETKQVKGRKTDVRDCQWIQKLFSAGILRHSFIPQGKFMELRHLVRERLDIISMGSTYVNKMQKCLELMNIKLPEVLSQIHGTSGINMIKAILSGNRDSNYLLSLCDERIQKYKGEKVLKALEGRYNDTYLFMLEQNMQLWDIHQNQIKKIDGEISRLLDELSVDKEEVVTGKAKAVRHHAPKIPGLHATMARLYGVDLTSIPGINDYTALRLIGETGVDMSRFPTVKSFVNWLTLSPKSHRSGKMKKNVRGMPCNVAGQIFKQCAQSLLNSKNNAIGSFMRKLRGRKDSRIAIKAGARKLAIAYYNTLTKGTAYVEEGTKRYEDQLQRREMALLKKMAKKYNMQLSENQIAA